MLTVESVIARLALSFNKLIPILFILVTVVFIFGIVRYIAAAGDEQQKGEGKRYITGGIIALAVMVSLWALVNILVTFVFDDPNPSPFIPGNDIVQPI